ncbi:hypothetical protein QWZ13_02790 [Reinekea marina]|uniref:hypothetical protein n=1 Tax=Reinekea marina TaxID=1310421 RepID=UPI0025B42278|nr:hypothetical protein [Reinekea marina]MDN3647837.1 hypothetical protein [Reinekea marina]
MCCDCDMATSLRFVVFVSIPPCYRLPLARKTAIIANYNSLNKNNKKLFVKGLNHGAIRRHSDFCESGRSRRHWPRR